MARLFLGGTFEAVERRVRLAEAGMDFRDFEWIDVAGFCQCLQLGEDYSSLVRTSATAEGIPQRAENTRAECQAAAAERQGSLQGLDGGLEIPLEPAGHTDEPVRAVVVGVEIENLAALTNGVLVATPKNV